MSHIKQPPNIGERIVVHGMSQKAVVEAVSWDRDAADWRIGLDWGEHGRSRVWAHDENRVWYRVSTSN